MPLVVSGTAVAEERGKKLDRIEKAGSDAFRKAERFFDQGKLDQAEAQCEAVNVIWGRRGDRMSPDVAHLLGRIRMRQERYAEATRFMAPNLDTAEVMHLDLGICYARLGRFAKAREFYNPGLILRHKSAYGDVRRYLPTVKTSQDIEAALLWCKGEALATVGQRDEATECFAAARVRFPKNMLLATELGFYAFNSGRYRESAKAYGVVQASNDAFLKQETQRALIEAEAKTRSAVRPAVIVLAGQGEASE